MPGKNVFFRAHCQQVSKAHYSPAKHKRSQCKLDEHSSLSSYRKDGTKVCGIVHYTCQIQAYCQTLEINFKLSPGKVFLPRFLCVMHNATFISAAMNLREAANFKCSLLSCSAVLGACHPTTEDPL